MKFSDKTKEEKLQIAKDIKEVERVMSGLGYDIYLTSGTLLGLIRDEDFIENDDDIDVCYLSHSTKASEVQQETRELYKKLHDIDALFLYRMATDDCKHTQNFTDPIAHKLYGQAQIKVNDTNIDLWTSWQDDWGDYWVSFIGCLGHWGLYYPLITKKFYGIDFFVPKGYKRLLFMFYDDWKTPKKEKPYDYWTEHPFLSQEAERE